MKRLTVLTAMLSGVLLASAALAGAPTAKAATTPALKQYMVMVPHSEAECLSALDDFATTQALAKFEFGCKSGDHTAYCMVSAKSAEAAAAQVPEKERATAKVVELHKFTPAELKHIHQTMEKK